METIPVPTDKQNKLKLSDELRRLDNLINSANELMVGGSSNLEEFPCAPNTSKIDDYMNIVNKMCQRM